MISLISSVTHMRGSVISIPVPGPRRSWIRKTWGFGSAIAIWITIGLAGGLDRASAADVAAPASWVVEDMPKANAQGWMTVFDGERVYGVSPTNRNIVAGNIFRKQSLLVLDASSGRDSGLRIPWKGTNGAIRFRGRNVTSQNVGINLGGTYVAWCNGDANALCGIGQTVRGVYKDIRTAKSGVKQDEMFDMEFRIEKGNMTLLINGQVRVQAKAPWVDELRAIGVGCFNGVAVVERVEARLPP